MLRASTRKVASSILPSMSTHFPLFSVLYELQYVGLGIIATWDLDFICNFPIALLKPGSIAPVNSENPCLRGLFLDSIAIFDGKLRLSSRISG